jgi:hypothetical protein
VIEPQAEETPKPVAEAPETTTPNNETTLDESGGES